MRRPILLCLVSIALVGLVAVACGGGGGSDSSAAATAAANATPSAELSITAKSLKFDKKALVAPPNTAVTVHYDNQDDGVLHDFAVYRDSSVKEKIYTSEPFNGKATRDEKFTTPGAGVYYFRCDVHPDMNGAFVVR